MFIGNGFPNTDTNPQADLSAFLAGVGGNTSQIPLNTFTTRTVPDVSALGMSSACYRNNSNGLDACTLDNAATCGASYESCVCNAPTTGAGCNGAGIALDRTTLMAGGYPECVVRNGVPSCRVTLFAWNTETQVIYSETQLMLVLNGNQTVIPNLLPATAPFCNNTLNDCLLEGACSLSTKQEGQLQLCESPTSCAAPPPSPGTRRTRRPCAAACSSSPPGCR